MDSTRMGTGERNRRGRHGLRQKLLRGARQDVQCLVRRGVRCGVRCEGLTFIELMVVIVILGILMGMGASTYTNFTRRTAVHVSTYEFLNACHHAKALALARQDFISIIFNDTDNERVIADGATAAQVTRMNSPYRTLNENGRDHWYALMNPTDRHPNDFEREWDHGKTFTPTARHIWKDGVYDPLGLQIGKRRYLQKGVRFGNADDEFVRAAGPLLMPAFQFAQSAYVTPNAFRNWRTSWSGSGDGAKSYMIKWGAQEAVSVLGHNNQMIDGVHVPFDNMTVQYGGTLWDSTMAVYFVDQSDETNYMAVVIKTYGAVMTVERYAREEW